jgi:hypothetical protein
MAGAAFVLRHRRGVSEEEPFNPDLADLIDVVKTADARQRKLLHEMAEDLHLETVEGPSSQVH